jgi:hypothetical protein
MTQDALFYESLNDALDAVVKACGGAKAVACKMWPEKTPDAAHRLLLACLNESRVEKLSPEHVLMLLRMGRERNCHAAINFLCRESGYGDPLPVDPEDEKARLQREFIEAQRAMQSLATRMEKIGLLA